MPMNDVRTARVPIGKEGENGLPEDIAEVVETHRETLELVAEGDDESARMARNILNKAGVEDDE